ncbi:general secretion pathway protein GspB [Vibrio maerlii]|uniref:general secretion pathway protein GspB n=1 Tax=Vibrio maerlii TaxID=2231648 RepID=UPI000E3BA81A|nr:general secretion pathway protein GspB [Vibrio maerlii]
MSNLIQALEQSELQHQQSRYDELHSHTPKTEHATHNRSISGLLVAMVLGVPIITGSVATYLDYQSKLSLALSQPSVEEVVVETPIDYTIERNVLPAELKSTRIAVNVEESKPVIEPRASQQAKPRPMEVTGTSNESLDLSQLDLSGLSSELALQVESALNNSNQSQQTQPSTSSDISHLEREASKWIGKLPALDFQTHNYTSNETKRWVKVNGVEFVQGDSINEEILLLEIAPRYSVIRFRGELIQIPALYDWQG